MPWEARRLSPRELDELWVGRQWRRSRDMELLATAICWIRGAWTEETDYDNILASLPDYDDERSRQTGWDIHAELERKIERE